MKTLEQSTTFQKRLNQLLQLIPESEEERLIGMVETIAQEVGHSPVAQSSKKARLRQALDNLRASYPYRDIDDPVEWQRSIRKDRELPYRQ